MTIAVVISYALLGLAFTLLVPTYRGPDEANHVDLVRRYRTQIGHPGYGSDVAPKFASTEASERLMGPPGSGRPPQRLEDAIPRPDRPTFDELADLGATDGLNPQSQHAPGYYVYAAVATAPLSLVTPPGVWTWDREVYAQRLLVLLLGLPLPLLASRAAMALGFARGEAAVVAACMLLVPGLTFIMSVVDNDGLAILSAWTALASALSFARHPSRSAALATAGAAAVCFLTKSTAGPTAALALVVLAVAWWRRWGTDRARWRTLAGCVALLALGASWYVTNLVRHGRIQPTGASPVRAPDGFDPSFLDFLWTWTRWLSWGFWGQTARRTGVELPAWTAVLLTFGAVALAVGATVWAVRRRSLLAVLAPLLAVQAGLLLRSTWRGHVRTGTYPAIQGRYLYPAALAFLLLVGAGLVLVIRRWAANPTQVAAAVALVGVGLHGLLGWSMLTGGYWEGPRPGDHLSSMLAWSPLPRLGSLAVLTLAVVGPVGAVVAAGAATARTGHLAASRSDSAPGEPSPYAP